MKPKSFAALALVAQLGALPLAARAQEAAADEAAAARTLQARDVFDLEFAADPQISPDGRHIVYVRTSFDIRTDVPRSNLWAIDADGSNHRPLRSGRQGHGSPRWSPDGTRIAYVSGAEGSPQLFVRWMDALRIDPAGPIELVDKWRRAQKLASYAVEQIQKAIAIWV